MSGPGARAALRPFRPVSFGRFTLLAPLAAGGMGEIFLARSTFQGGLDKLCVIKKVLPQLAEDPDFVGRFLDEARTLVALQHGSIAQVYDTGSFDGDYWIALEFVDGKDLRRLMQRVRSNGSRLPAVLSLYIALRVLEALAYAHRKKDESGLDLGLVHRDVSPQNILVSYEGEVKVIDFGLAKSKLSLGLSQPQAVLGKLYYMPPEQARGDAVDRRSDLYAVGLVLYELLSGQNPFEDAAQEQLFSRICAPRITPIQELEPTLPQGVADALAKALAPNPESRFRTAEQMRAALSACLSELAPDVGPEQLATYVVTLFEEEHRRERAILARFALRSASEGETFGDAAPAASHDETQPIAAPEPAAPVSAQDTDSNGDPTAPHLSSPTFRFADPQPPHRADDPPPHLAAPTLRGSGLPDVPWDRRASGTRAVVSATAPLPGAEPATRPWYEAQNEEDRLHRSLLTSGGGSQPGDPSPSNDGLWGDEEKIETFSGTIVSASAVQREAQLRRVQESQREEARPETEATASVGIALQPVQAASEGSVLRQDHAPAHAPAHAQAQPQAQPQAQAQPQPQAPNDADLHHEALRSSTDADPDHRSRKALYLALALLLFAGAGTAYWLEARRPTEAGGTGFAPRLEAAPLPVAVEAAPASDPRIQQELAPPVLEPGSDVAPPTVAADPDPASIPQPQQEPELEATPPPVAVDLAPAPEQLPQEPALEAPAAAPRIASPAPVEPPPAPSPAAIPPKPPAAQGESTQMQPAPKPAAPTIDRRQELILRRETLRRSFSDLVVDHGAGQIGTIVIELERAVGSSFDRFIDAPEQYDTLDRQLGELEQILEERRRAFQ